MILPAEQHCSTYLKVKLFLLATPTGKVAAAANHGVPDEAMLGPGNPGWDPRLMQPHCCDGSAASHMGKREAALHGHPS